MADYSLSGTHLKLNQLCDKIGSDYFVMPVFINIFEMSAYDFISRKVKEIEKTQTIVDDIRDLIIPKSLNVISDPSSLGDYITGLPSDYFRLLAHNVYYKDGTECRRSDLIKHAEYETAKLNPNKKPSRYYPLILQYASTFQISAGPDAIPSSLKITYCKKPSFADVSNPQIRIVNLPDDSIDNILKKTVVELFNKTADPRFASSDKLEKEYQKIFK
tara:strand:+ start:26 stop:676 length:651 start_codon:yes stop_codon:yes gene_type:complete